MRTALRVIALAILIVALALWFFGGPNLGWTKTSAAVKHLDPITGLEQVVWEKRFLPGIDFLAAGVLGSLALFGLSFLFRRPSAPHQVVEKSG